MAVKLNDNNFWSALFFSELIRHGVKYACITPGSRSTPLTCAIAENPKVEKFIFVDERSSAYFALGLAKASKTPVLLICTSGTAVANFHPAIVEACKSKIPLIVCTADRTYENLYNESNQTIDQNNFFANHTNWYFNLPIPEITYEKLSRLKQIAERTFIEATVNNSGPVHVNFPFRKPLEPNSFNIGLDDKDFEKMQTLFSTAHKIISPETTKSIDIKFISDSILSNPKGVIIVNPDNYNEAFESEVLKLSNYIKFPIFADAASSLRFGNSDQSCILSNYESIIRNERLCDIYAPSFAIIFGRNNTSGKLDNFISTYIKDVVIVNEFGSYSDASLANKTIIKTKPEEFCKSVNLYLSNFAVEKNSTNFTSLTTINTQIEVLKRTYFTQTDELFEGKVVHKISGLLPDGSNLFIGNSTAIRDLNIFASTTLNKINVYSNRGASGIDGLISTALGIASTKRSKNNYMILGDLSFLHDVTGLFASVKYEIPLNIFLMDNNGGGIFDILPISSNEDFFEPYFKTPHNLDLKKLCFAFDANYFAVSNLQQLENLFYDNHQNGKLNIFHIKTNSQTSNKFRKAYFEMTNKV